jgi:hypothetical protein
MKVLRLRRVLVFGRRQSRACVRGHHVRGHHVRACVRACVHHNYYETHLLFSSKLAVGSDSPKITKHPSFHSIGALPCFVMLSNVEA